MYYIAKIDCAYKQIYDNSGTLMQWRKYLLFINGI